MPRRTGRLPQYRSLLGYLMTHALLLVPGWNHEISPESTTRGFFEFFIIERGITWGRSLLDWIFLLIHIHVFFCLLARENMRPPTVRLP